MRYKEITESVYRTVPEDGRFDEIIEKYLNNGKFIYRGFEASPSQNIVFANGELMNRKSANSENYHVLIVDNVPEWRNYPKRSKSFISSTEDYAASAYGDVFYVIPLENQTVAQCPSFDFWDSFPNGMKGTPFNSIHEINEYLNDINDIVNRNIGARGRFIPDDNFEKFKYYLDELNEYINQNPEWFENEVDISFLTLDLFDTYREILNPNNNDFIEFPYSMYLPPDHPKEIWLSGKVLMVRQEYID